MTQKCCLTAGSKTATALLVRSLSILTLPTDRKAKAMNMNEKENVKPEIELAVEEIEEMIAPAVTQNHNEKVEVDLTVEEAEAVIAPGPLLQHNETLLLG